MSNLPPAAWYPDPDHPERLRWWDGNQWTGHVETTDQAESVFVPSQQGSHPLAGAERPVEPAIDAAIPQRSRLLARHWVAMFACLAVVASLAFVIGSRRGDEAAHEDATEVGATTATAEQGTADSPRVAAESASPEQSHEPAISDEQSPLKVRDPSAPTLGYLLPETGPLGFLSPPLIAGIEMAVDEVNRSGHFRGTVSVMGGDTGGDPALARSSANRLAGAVDAIVGPAASGMTLAVTGDLEDMNIPHCSPSNTSPTFTHKPTTTYLRTASSDENEALVLASVLSELGTTHAAILHRNDDYGAEIAQLLSIVASEDYGITTSSFAYAPSGSTSSAIADAASSGAGAFAIIAFDEADEILRDLTARGLTPSAGIAVVGGDGLRSPQLSMSHHPAMDGLIGVAPAPTHDPDFLRDLQPYLEADDTWFAGQAYDCAAVLMLAHYASAIGMAPSPLPALELVNDGTERCSRILPCLEHLSEGRSVEYVTQAGETLSQRFSGTWQPDGGTYEVWEFSEGEITSRGTEHVVSY